MSVEKKLRRIGIGSALLDCLISWANNNSQIEKINLQVHSTNKPAIALYESKGFTVEGIRKKELKYSQNRYVDSVLMASWV